MPKSDSKELEDFLASCCDSVEQIMILQLLHASPDRAWTISELTRELRSSDASIEQRIEDFYKRNVLERPSNEEPSRHRFKPKSDEMARKIDLLMKFYREKPSRVIEMIYSRPPRALTAFADAFKFRKGED